MTTSPLVAAAADYLSRGLSVIALTGKTPNVQVHRHGLKQPLTGAPEPADFEGVLHDVFDHPATTGIGILTNWPFVVVDIDGEEGAVQWHELVGGDALVTHGGWAAVTGRGLHLWFLTGTETGTIKLGPKLDLKGTGGYVVAPPSIHPDTGKPYGWIIEPSDELPPPVPPALAERITQHVDDIDRAVRAAGYKRAVYRARDVEYGTAPDFSGILKKMAAAEEGNRNDLLHWAARSLADENATDADFEALRAVAEGAGLTSIEVKRTIRSARRG